MGKIKYYMEKGQPKVIMDQNTAIEAKRAIKSFKAGIGKSPFNEVSQIRLTGEHIAEEFLKDNVSKLLAKEKFVSEVGAISGQIMFLQTVEKKISELLG